METKTPTTVAGGARDHELLPLLLVGLSIEAIADRLSLGVSTVQRRIADPERPLRGTGHPFGQNAERRTRGNRPGNRMSKATFSRLSPNPAKGRCP